MKTVIKYWTLTWALSLLVLMSCEKPEPVNAADAQLTGTWKLDAITYGLAQIRVQGDKLPYSETIEFKANGDYTITRDQKLVEAGDMYTGQNMSGLPQDKAIFYKKDNTYQTYEITDGRLFLYQRADQGAVIADGSTYEYKRQ
jgi:hypothetical protein